MIFIIGFMIYEGSYSYAAYMSCFGVGMGNDRPGSEERCALPALRRAQESMVQ